MAELGPLPTNCIRFTIPFQPDNVVLEIPIADLAELALRPVRWMKLVAWGVLGCEGDVQDVQEAPLPQDLPMANLSSGEYTFVPAPDPRGIETVHLLNLEHTRTTARSMASQASAAYRCPDPAPARRDTILEDRDGARCVFTGYTQSQRAHVIPQRFSHKTAALRELSDERDLGLGHHLDPENTITVLINLHMDWDARHGFILATEDRFLRNDDIPPATTPPGSAHPSWLVRAEPQGRAPAYVWQTLGDRAGSVTQLVVRHNERARFKNPASPSLPNPRAVNYIYAAAMVRQFLQPALKAELLRILSRSTGEPAMPDDDQPELGDDGEMDAFELLFRLTHRGQFLDYYEKQQRVADEAKMRRLDEWRRSLPDRDSAEM